MNLVQQKAIEHLEDLIKKLKDQTAIIDRFDIAGENDVGGHYSLANIGVFYISELKPSINWAHVSLEYKWLARDKDGGAFLYSRRPVVLDRYESWNGGEITIAETFSSYDPGTCDWKDSLVERPE